MFWLLSVWKSHLCCENRIRHVKNEADQPIVSCDEAESEYLKKKCADSLWKRGEQPRPTRDGVMSRFSEIAATATVAEKNQGN